MKARQVPEMIKAMGYERGSVHIMSALVEQVNQQEKQIQELTGMLNKMVDTLANVVEGSHGMRSEMISTLKRAGINVSAEEKEGDGLGPATELIGQDKKQ